LIRIVNRNLLMAAMLKLHQHSAGAASKEPQAIGKSAQAIHKDSLVVDSYGLPAEFEITGEKSMTVL